jgi:cytidine deaminase
VFSPAYASTRNPAWAFVPNMPPEMLKHRQTRIIAIVAVDADGAVRPPCGRCRELIRQVDAGNWNTSVIVAENTVVKLAELLPFATPAIEPSSSRTS